MEHRNGFRSVQEDRFYHPYNRKKEVNSLLREHGGDILRSDNFNRSREYMQHGSMSVKRHSIDVARYSVAISRRLGIRCNQRDLIRGALLHDYFLYDWHEKDAGHRLHGFYHPGTALKNASREYQLTKRQRDIIKKHMWPLTVVPPRCREAWIVTAADKWCSLLETLKVHKGHGGTL